jgi:hypothetical protein
MLFASIPHAVVSLIVTGLVERKYAAAMIAIAMITVWRRLVMRGEGERVKRGRSGRRIRRVRRREMEGK